MVWKGREGKGREGKGRGVLGVFLLFVMYVCVWVRKGLGWIGLLQAREREFMMMMITLLVIPDINLHCCYVHDPDLTDP